MTLKLDANTGKWIDDGLVSDSTPSNTPDISTLDSMDAEGLRKLIRRVCQAGWGYGSLTGKELLEMALKTKDEAYEALKLTALTLAVNASDWREFNALATFWSEREKGKPQGTSPQVNIGSAGDMKIEVVLIKPGDPKLIEG